MSWAISSVSRMRARQLRLASYPSALLAVRIAAAAFQANHFGWSPPTIDQRVLLENACCEHAAAFADSTHMPEIDLLSLLGSSRPAVELAGHTRSYQRTRVVANIAVLVATPLLAVYVTHRSFAVEVIVTLAVAVLLHARFRPNAPLVEMTAVDTASYLLMTVMLDLPEIVLFVVITQTYVVFLFVPLRAAWLSGAGFTVLGLVAVSTAMALSRLDRSFAENMTLLVAVTLSTVIPTMATMTQAALELHRRRHSEESLRQEKEQALLELSTAQIELVNAQKLEAIGGLAAGIAHEINTPIQYVGDNNRFVKESLPGLMAVANAASALSHDLQAGRPTDVSHQTLTVAAGSADIDYLAAEIPEAIDESLAGIERIAKIVQALKSFAHPGSDELVPEDLNEIIRTTVAVSRNEWKYVAEVDLDGLDADLPHVPALAGPLKQVLLNLVVNAAHAIEPVHTSSGEKGKISITSSIENDSALICVRDTGTGIPEEVQERIFDPFFTTKEVGRGSGQGLSIAKSIVEKHNGKLLFRTAAGEGTTFTIQLPRSNATSDQDQTVGAAN